MILRCPVSRRRSFFWHRSLYCLRSHLSGKSIEVLGRNWNFWPQYFCIYVIFTLQCIDAINAQASKFISLPNLSQQKEIMSAIEKKTGFPQCLGILDFFFRAMIFFTFYKIYNLLYLATNHFTGYIDGTIVPIPKPKDSGTDFWSHKGISF